MVSWIYYARMCPELRCQPDSGGIVTRTKPFLIAAAVIAAAAFPAHAEQRQYVIVLIADKSPGSCDKGGGAYVVDVSKETISLANVNSTASPQFKVAIPADGNVKTEYKSSAGGRMEFTGNVRTGQYELFNWSTSCRYRLVLKK
jgi:hypothetical protein